MHKHIERFIHIEKPMQHIGTCTYTKIDAHYAYAHRFKNIVHTLRHTNAQMFRNINTDTQITKRHKNMLIHTHRHAHIHSNACRLMHIYVYE